jgi:hypothetical protein
MGYSGPADAEGKRRSCSTDEVTRLTGNPSAWTFTTSIPPRVEMDTPEVVFRIGVNHTYLQDMVRAIGDRDEDLELRFIDPLKAIVILPTMHGNRKGLLMPLRIQKEEEETEGQEG